MDLVRRRVIAWLVVASIAGAASGCGGSTVSPTPATTATGSSSGSRSSAATAAPPNPSATVAEGRRSDLDVLVEKLRMFHPNPFLDEGEAAFLERVDAVKDQAADLSDAGFMVAVMRLMGHRDRDGHSGAWALAQTEERLHALPIWLWDFPDGPRIVAAQPSVSDLVGGRVVSVGHVPIDEARRLVDPLVPRDNASSLRANLPIYLTIPEVVGELGMMAAGEPALTVELPDGSRREVREAAIDMPSLQAWIFGLHHDEYPAGLPPDEDGPRYLRHTDLPYWSEPLDDEGLYVGYNHVTSDDGAGHSIGSLASAIADAAPAHRDAPFIVDLRNNDGGDAGTYFALVDAVQTMAHERPGRVALITARGTFSAAGLFVAELELGDAGKDIRLAGEPPGGAPNVYAEVKVVTLPASGIVVLVSSRYHERATGPDASLLELTPDIPVEVSWDDYAARRDPVLETTLRALAGG